MKCNVCGVSSEWAACGAGHSHRAGDCPSFKQSQQMTMKSIEVAWDLLKQQKDDDEKAKRKLIACLKKEGGAASLEDCCKACDRSKAECKKLINTMDNVKISPHGDVILMDGL